MLLRKQKKIKNCCFNIASQITPERQYEIGEYTINSNDNKNLRFIAIKTEGQIQIKNIFNMSDNEKKEKDWYNKILYSKKQLDLMHGLFTGEYREINVCAEKYFNTPSMTSNPYEINRNAINFISNSLLFIEYMENLVKKSFSSSFTYWKTMQSNFFDNSVEYRILYNLRNHVQHAGYPISTIHQKLVEKEGIEVKEIAFCLSKHELSKNKGLNRHIKEYLQNLPYDQDEISIMPMISIYSAQIETLYLQILCFFLETYLDDIKVYLKNLEEQKIIEQRFVASISKENYLKGNIEDFQLPEELPSASSIQFFLKDFVDKDLLKISPQK